MECITNVTFNYSIDDQEINKFKSKVVEFIEEETGESDIVAEDIPNKIVYKFLRETLGTYIDEIKKGGVYNNGILLDDYFNTISFDYYGENVRELIKQLSNQIYGNEETNTETTNTNNCVKSNQIYSPENYISAITGLYYFLKHNTHPINEIQDILSEHGYELWDYPLTEINHIVENNLNVVLVNCSYYEGDKYIDEYRWFEVPEDFKEDEDEEDTK